MRTIGEWFRRIGYLIRGGRMDEELREEMAAHRAEMNEPERFGNGLRLREEARDVWGLVWIDGAVRDVHHAFRAIRRMPAVAAVIIVSLGIGIGLNTTVYTWIDAMMLNPIPGIEGASEFFLVEPLSETGVFPGASWPEYHDLRDRLSSFSDLAAFRMVPLNIGTPDRNERTYGLLVSDNYFAVLGLEPRAGRFVLSDTVRRAGGEAEVVISNGFWQTHFNGSIDAIGQQIVVNGRNLTVIGVTPPGFYGTVLGVDFAMWIPATIGPLVTPGALESRTDRAYYIAGRLGEGGGHGAAQAELDTAMAELAGEYPESNANVTGKVLPYWQAARGPQRLIVYGTVLLQGLMLLLLVVVCVNTANLLLARAATRGREIGIRMAMGAGRWRVVRLLMIEHMILAGAGAGVGVVLAIWGTNALRAVPLPTFLPLRLDTTVNVGAIGVAASLALLSAAAFGLPPALQLVRSNYLRVPRADTGSVGGSLTRKTLMAAEAAVALPVLVVAGLFVGSFRDSQTVDPGFDRDGVLVAAYDLSGAGGNVDSEISRTFATRFLARVEEQPGVAAAAIASSVPLDIHGLPQRGFVLEGEARTDGALDQALVNIVTPGYFRTMGIAFIAGSDFSDMSASLDTPEVIVNEAFVSRYLDGREPVGRRVQTGGRDSVIAGVVADSVYNRFDEAPTPIIYRSFAANPLPYAQIHVRTPPGTETLLGQRLRRIARDIEPALPLYDVRTMAQHVDTNLFLTRIPARMFLVLAPLLLLLVAVGIYAVVAFSVSRRTREIGIRLALGADAGGVVKEIVGQTMTVILYGAGVGWVLAFVPQEHLAPGEPLNKLAFLGVPALLLAVSTLASWLPARRAARIDPMESLRED